MFPLKRTQLADEPTQRFQDNVLSFVAQIQQNPTTDAKLLKVTIPSGGLTTSQDLSLNHAFGRSALGFTCVSKPLVADFYISPTSNPQPGSYLLVRCSVALGAGLQFSFLVY